MNIQAFYKLIALSMALLLLSLRQVSAQGGKSSVGRKDVETDFYFTEGMKFYILGKYDTALENFEKAADIKTKNAGIQYKIATCHFKLKQLGKAENHAQSALKFDENNKYHYELLAEIYKAQFKYKAATKVYKKLMNNVKGAASYNYHLAELHLLQKDYGEAIEAYETLEKSFGLSEDVIYAKQKIYLQQGKFNKAIEEGKKLVSFAPEETRYVVALAELLVTNNKLNEALPLLEEIEKQKKDPDPRVYLLLASIYKSKGEEAKAINQLKKAFSDPEINGDEKVKLLVQYAQQGDKIKVSNELVLLAKTVVEMHPEQAQANTIYADMLAVQGKKKEALKYYIKAARKDNSVLQVWTQVLVLESDLNMMDSLVVHSEEALETFPNYALFWLYNGTALLSTNQFEEASGALEEGKRLSFNNKDLLNEFNARLGDAYNGLKQYEKSFGYYEEVLKQNANHAYTLNNYSYFLALRKQNLDKAKKMAARLVKNNPDDATYLDTYGWVLYVAKDYKNAQKYLEKSLEKSPEGTTYEHYGDVLFKLGNTAKAIEQWQKAKELGGTSQFIDKKIADKKLYE
ncbi:tetratricopeptide repeat protein [uncultured Microscilla sp.]|uniref:tetratricopeptide repeat protein n=1 Tax=uncultured Microscilla sp. TaxID=432653 RepID=UPI00260565F8|nr:tetratricopeptide repeat protein [uncultured Microscilla sp.]